MGASRSFQPGVREDAPRACARLREDNAGRSWFQWQDQPLTGRADGENYQVGFLSVADVPYPELVEASRDIARTMYARRYNGR